ncbi:MAG: hypothetical protein DI590_05680 [Methylorubrum populi]|nr:MAG: hypothetical protein DI590_05680 [Methylorubrum populi]
MPTKPPIDRTAEEAQVTGPGPAPVPPSEADAPMPTAENAVYQFKPGPGTSILDIKEICLMQIMQLVNGPEIEPGALRSMTMQGHRFNQLSEPAKRWFEPVTPAAPEA